MVVNRQDTGMSQRRTGLRGRCVRLVTPVLGVVLLAVSIGGTLAAGRSAALADLDYAMGSEATSHSAALYEYFDRAQSLALLLANDSAFTQFDPGIAATGVPDVTEASTQASEAMAYLEELYPGRISEACLIDSTGTELARVVRGKVAPASELSTEEAKSPFFAPTMALRQGQVYQAEPYLSPDTDEWVISNSTPMVTSAGTVWGMVHFELSLDSFRPGKDASPDAGLTTTIVDTRTDRILLETDVVVSNGPLGRPGPDGIQTLAAATTDVTTGALGEQRVSMASVRPLLGNANFWAVMVTAPVASAGWARSIGPAPMATALAAVLMLVLAGVNMRRQHRALRDASLTDELTGMPNRRLLSNRLEQSLARARRDETSCAVLLIDLDRFKEVNDTLGHHHGDELLRAVAIRLRGAFRDCDTVARLGGDEFAVLLPDVTDQEHALELAGRCFAALQGSFIIEGVALDVEASIGLALAPEHGTDGNQLLRSADVAMYDAKSRKCGIVAYDADLDGNTLTRLTLLSDLRRALRDGELVMHYQPKVSMSTDRVVAVEALVRWQHPTRGLLSPGEFVPVAEGTGMILPLTLRTLELGIAQARRWLDEGRPMQVAVNLSPWCLLDLEFPQSLQALILEYGLPPDLLRLEITEGTVMADPDRALTILTALRASGHSLSIDDFGTGYSSLSYLQRLPIDELKIDRTFVTEMLAGDSGEVLVRSAIDLAHNLGLSVVAEGIEDQQTLDALALLGCDVAQGYHLARPMTSAALDRWLVTGVARPTSVMHD